MAVLNFGLVNEQQWDMNFRLRTAIVVHKFNESGYEFPAIVNFSLYHDFI
jgi:hypothetical protein